MRAPQTKLARSPAAPAISAPLPREAERRRTPGTAAMHVPKGIRWAHVWIEPHPVPMSGMAREGKQDLPTVGIAP
jgi:hypothetical protein